MAPRPGAAPLATRPEPARENARLKRLVDLGVGALAGALFLPLMAAIALAIRWESGGPVFHRQVRAGLHGRPFRLWKFRTMVEHAEAWTGPVWCRPGDPRVTRLGRWLRRTSLDELPQLLNVLRGEMSLVGPRPERPELVLGFCARIPEYAARQRMPPGMTGWAQVHGWRGATSLEKRVEFDLHYISNWSIALDFRILFLTLWHGFRNENAG